MIIASTSCTVEGAAAAVGIHVSTLHDWQARGLVEESGRFHEFSKALACARAKSEASLAAMVAQAGKTDWRAAAWILERRFPFQWGRPLAIAREVEEMMKLSDEELTQRITLNWEAPHPDEEA